MTINYNDNPLISILTATWNRGDYLHKVWQGLSNQTYKNFEWIVANDGSNDDTVNIIKSLSIKSSFKIKFINANIRIGKARLDNEMIKYSDGEFLLSNDSDDCLLPNTLLDLINTWKTIPDLKKKLYLGVLALCADVNNNIQTTGYIENNKIKDMEYSDFQVESHGDALVMVRKDLIGERKFLEVDFLIHEGSLWNELYINKRIIFLQKILKIMDRSAPHSVSFGNKMEYNRGKAFAIMKMENKFFFYRKNIFTRLKIVIVYFRYSYLGDISFYKSIKNWPILNRNIFLILLYPVGLIFALRDLMLGKVVKTHKEFDKNNAKVLIKYSIYN